jgi:hypothetical protein
VTAAAVDVGFGTALGTIGGRGVGLVIGTVVDERREQQLRL